VGARGDAHWRLRGRRGRRDACPVGPGATCFECGESNSSVAVTSGQSGATWSTLTRDATAAGAAGDVVHLEVACENASALMSPMGNGSKAASLARSPPNSVLVQRAARLDARSEVRQPVAGIPANDQPERSHGVLVAHVKQAP
jgi:hypothetical protein